MGQGYLIDTNTTIDYLSDKLPAKSAEFIGKIDSQLSVISRMELLAWPNATEEQLKVLEAFVGSSNIFSLSEPVIIESIRIRKTYRIKLPDAIIAATALVFDLTLITLNTVDFKNISGLKLINSHKLAPVK